MKALYNEIDRFCCDWLSNLMDAGLISPGKIDDRPIQELTADDVRGFDRVHFFAGIAGWDYALQLAGWPADRPVWTGSCPCQPFSAAGQRKGFEDERHLWPIFRDLIAKCRPATVFGEQVASAADWLRLVRSDLEALDYAVGAIPVEAASAGAFHLRDRYWFVADGESQQVGSTGQPWECGDVGNDPRVGRAEGRPEHEIRRGRNATADDGGMVNAASQSSREPNDADDAIPDERQAWPISGSTGVDSDMADANDARPQRRFAMSERANQRTARADGLADADVFSGRLGNQQPAGQFEKHDGDPRTCLDWLTGADGKARPVVPGIRLLAHGFPNRMGLLRGFGNAIDPRPASAFIAAFMDCQHTEGLAA